MMISTRSAGLTDVGRRRTVNEDGFLASAEDDLYVVVDGMGGHQGGDVAAAIAIEAVAQGYRASAERGEARLASAVQLANRRIFERSKSDRSCQGIGAAIAAMAINRGPEGAAVHLAHVGDCRIYRFRRLELEPLTRDHSLLNEYRIAKPDATAEELAHLPKNVIVRALGVRDEVDVTRASHPARPGDLYLLCTHGLHGELEDDEIAAVLRDNIDVTAAARALVQAARDYGVCGDDIACVVVDLRLG